MSATSGLDFLLSSEQETASFAARLAALCKTGDCILLHGEVGSGKTTFARGFISSIAASADEIVSPTFTLIQTYPLINGGEICHCDLYRLKSPAELDELGLDEAMEKGIVLIEWPEIATGRMPASALNIALEIAGEGRSIALNGDVLVWSERFNELKRNII